MNNFSRRNLLKGFVAASTASVVSSSVIAKENGKHIHHVNENNTLIDTAHDCIKTGQLCLDHCIDLFKQGDNSVADCADKVTEMLAMCTALSQMAAYQSSHLKELVKVCIDVCKDCKKACEKHADKHMACEACAESCEECISACEKIAA